MASLNWLAPILQGLGQGVSQLPQVHRQRRMENLETDLRRQQMEREALEMSLLPEQEARAKAEAARAEAEHNRTLRTADWTEAFRTAEARPEGTELTPDQMATYDKFGFAYNKPNMGRIVNDHDDPTYTGTHKAFEGPALLRAQLTEAGRTSRFQQDLDLRRRRLEQDARIAEISTRLRQAGLDISAAALAQRMAESAWRMNDAEIDNELNRYLAGVRANPMAGLAGLFGAGTNIPQVAPPPSTRPLAPQTPAAPAAPPVGGRYPGL